MLTYRLNKTKKGTKVQFFEGDKNVSYAEEGNPVYRDDQGREYVHVPNVKDNLFLFNGCIKDAVDEVINGIGDAILCGNNMNIFSCGISVVMFLNRNIGNLMKYQSIQGWKGARFGYALTESFSNSFGGLSYFDEEGKFTWDKKTQKVFETKEEVEQKVKEYQAAAEKLAKDDGYKKLSADELRDCPDIILHMLWNLLPNSEEDEGKYILEIVQEVFLEKEN